VATYTYQRLVEAVERAFVAGAEGPEILQRVQADIPGVQLEDIIIAGRLRQARLHMADADWPAAASCGVQLARDLTGMEEIGPGAAWNFLRNLDHPLVAEMVRLLDAAVPVYLRLKAHTRPRRRFLRTMAMMMRVNAASRMR
jgi:hypothetical protein